MGQAVSGPIEQSRSRALAESRPAWAAPLAAGLAALAIAIVVLTVVLEVANLAQIHTLSGTDLEDIVPPVSLGLVGALVAARQSRNPTGWLFLLVAVVAGLQGLADQDARFALITHPGAPGGVWALWLDSWVINTVFPIGALAFVLLLFMTAVLSIPGMFSPGDLSTGTTFATVLNPVGVPVDSVVGSIFGSLGVLWIPGLLLVIVAASAPLVRMRRSHGDERQQLKWIAYAVIVSAAVVVVTSIGEAFAPAFPDLSDLAITLGFGCALPVAAGIAIFKHRLYDIDLVISRTLVYGSLAVFISAVYVGIAVGLGSVIGGGGKPNLALSIVATAIVAVGFQPVRERLQRVANRLVYGKRATPYEVLSQFSERVAESYAVDDVMPRMARVLAEGTGAQRADVWLRNGQIWREAAVWPATAEPADSMPAVNGTLPEIAGVSRLVEVRHQGTLLGALGVTKRSGEALTPVEEKLLVDLAGQAGLVLRNVGLTADLQARLDDLRASRQRLVTAQDQERRRLERNLHDGAQQHLVAIKVKIGLAEMLLHRDPARARQTLDQLKSDADEALETLRDLARGIYPPLLADKGLQVALESQARKATVPVSVEADGIGRYPQDIEAAVYFCVLEALQNIQKYAQASHVVVRLRHEDGNIAFDVIDDGSGFDITSMKRGAGLTNMADRLDALGGQLHISSVLGEGTTYPGRWRWSAQRSLETRVRVECRRRRSHSVEMAARGARRASHDDAGAAVESRHVAATAHRRTDARSSRSAQRARARPFHETGAAVQRQRSRSATRSLSRTGIQWFPGVPLTRARNRSAPPHRGDRCAT
jgi:signal transduction histidine kinase